MGEDALLGTIVNTVAVFVGGLIGLLFKNGLKENYRGILTQAIGLAVVFVGISGSLAGMFAGGASPVLFIISLTLGALAGEWLRIEARLAALGDFLQARLAPAGQGGEKTGEEPGEQTAGGKKPSFSQGFAAASLIFCVGTMSILGAFESGVRGDHSILYAKSLLDGVIALVMASTMGVGVLFGGLTVLVYQGLLTLLAGWVSPFMTADMMREIGTVGGILVCAIGLNLLEITRLRVGNMLPAMLVPVVWYGLKGAFGF